MAPIYASGYEESKNGYIYKSSDVLINEEPQMQMIVDPKSPMLSSRSAKVTLL